MRTENRLLCVLQGHDTSPNSASFTPNKTPSPESCWASDLVQYAESFGFGTVGVQWRTEGDTKYKQLLGFDEGVWSVKHHLLRGRPATRPSLVPVRPVVAPRNRKPQMGTVHEMLINRPKCLPNNGENYAVCPTPRIGRVICVN